MKEIEIPLNTVKDDFEKFLSTEKNSRIFFSGSFGIGKTYFLNDFFDSKKDNYEVFHLYPINYQISGNEDIVELIKYDILVELLKKNKNILQENEINGFKDSALLLYSWFKKRFSINSTLKTVFSFSELLPEPLGKIGRPLKDLLELDKEFQEFKEKYKEGEKNLVKKYAEQIKTKNISETDYISYLLKEKIIQQKNGKKSILVLDDLDRVDPEHIFRILNILSAYFERESTNKFGFDSIIIVADYSNLKHIFYHRYGTRADFSGYIDKFFTISPYYFDNKKAIMDMIDEITKSIKNEEPGLNSTIGEGGYLKLFLGHIFLKTVDAGIINLRQLLKLTKFQSLEFEKGSYQVDHFSKNGFRIIFNKAIKVAIISFSNVEVFIDKIKEIKNLKTNDKALIPYEVYIQEMLKSLDISIPDSTSESITWRNYSISKGDNNFEPVKVSGNQSEKLFYDLLIEYITNKKHLTNSYSNYEN